VVFVQKQPPPFFPSLSYDRVPGLCSFPHCGRPGLHPSSPKNTHCAFFPFFAFCFFLNPKPGIPLKENSIASSCFSSPLFLWAWFSGKRLPVRQSPFSSRRLVVYPVSIQYRHFEVWSRRTFFISSTGLILEVFVEPGLPCSFSPFPP